MQRSRRQLLGVTILEVVFAMGIVAFAMGGIYLTCWKSMQLVREAHRMVNASQILQEKTEFLRAQALQQWSVLLTGSTAATLAPFAGPPTPMEVQMQSVASLTEELTVAPCPALILSSGATVMVSPAPTPLYVLTRTITYSGGAPSASFTYGQAGAASSPPSINTLAANLKLTWKLNPAASAHSYSREFNAIIANPKFSP